MSGSHPSSSAMSMSTDLPAFGSSRCMNHSSVLFPCCRSSCSEVSERMRFVVRAR